MIVMLGRDGKGVIFVTYKAFAFDLAISMLKQGSWLHEQQLDEGS